ncbi:hypothetical protein DFH09DRAFT_887659, partial [Mycena vulgaris]
VFVDDRDAQVQYSPSGGWIFAGTQREIPWSSRSRVSGGNEFPCQYPLNSKSAGTSVTLYGTLEAGRGATMTFHVDDSPDTVYSAPTTTSAIYHQLLWTSEVLSDGSHTLFI